MARRRKFWGWGLEGDGPDEAQSLGIAAALSKRFGTPLELAPEPRIDDVELPKPRLEPPAALASICASTPSVCNSARPSKRISRPTRSAI